MDELTNLMNDKLTFDNENKLDINLMAHEQTFNQMDKLPIERFPVLPLEVVNYYCRTHFDDEDFVYVLFELPSAIQTIISNGGYPDIISYLRRDLESKKDAYPDYINDAYSRIIMLYDKVIDYNMTIEAELEPDIDIWPVSYVNNVHAVCECIHNNFNLNMDDHMYSNLIPYYREIYYGLSIIVSQLNMICNYYLEKGITNPNDFAKRHRTHFMRLVNNLCIIMIHNKFVWDNFENNHVAMNETDMITNDKDPFEMDMEPDASWKLTWPAN